MQIIRLSNKKNNNIIYKFFSALINIVSHYYKFTYETPHFLKILYAKKGIINILEISFTKNYFSESFR